MSADRGYKNLCQRVQITMLSNPLDSAFTVSVPLPRRRAPPWLDPPVMGPQVTPSLAHSRLVPWAGSPTWPTETFTCSLVRHLP